MLYAILVEGDLTISSFSDAYNFLRVVFLLEETRAFSQIYKKKKSVNLYAAGVREKVLLLFLA